MKNLSKALFLTLISLHSAGLAYADHDGGRSRRVGDADLTRFHAAKNDSDSRRKSNDHDDRDDRDDRKDSKKLLTVNCGDIITSSAKIANDLNCPNTTGFALLVEGNNISVDGNGHKITAPNAAAGLYVQGSGVSVSAFQINGISNGYGIFAYSSPAVSIRNNNVSQNQTGIMLYTDNLQMSSVSVSGNIATGNSLFGVRSGQDGSGNIDNPKIQNNDFSNSGSYAMLITASKYEVNGCDRNKLSGSTNGIYLKTGQFNIHDISLTKEDIKKIEIFVDSASFVKVSNVDLSSRIPGDSNQERIGMDLYRVSQFDIWFLAAYNNDAGLKFETENGVSPTGNIRGCNIGGQTVAGIIFVSYDTTQYGSVHMAGNAFQETGSVQNILLAGAASSLVIQ